MTPPHIRCPACGAVSSHPKDIKEGYCGRCHAWTADDTEPAHLTQTDARLR
jgi:ribosomal protein S27AE